MPCLLYTDDLKIFTTVKTMEDCWRLQNNLCNLSRWCTINKLPLNVAKCNVMSFTRNLSCVTFDYDIDGIKLERPATFRDLGIVFDPKLTFSSHIQTIAGEALRTLGFIIRNSRDFVSVNTLKILYCSFVRSKLEYASLVWCPNYNIHINTLEYIQRRFLKLLYFRSHGAYPPVGYSHCNSLNEF